MVVTRSIVKEADEPSDTNSDSTDTNSEAEGEEGEPAITEMQQAYLSYYIELLNQTIHNRKYDIALVYGLVVLGVNLSGQGFRGADTYLSILLVVIKVAHFIIV
jgi:hypothetical protein